jgi:putative Mg2+ transporter-C (MgtC) family protein
MENFTWQGVISQIFFVGQILLAIILGALIGWQREVRGKAAGGRTYALVCAGSALFTILSINAFPGSDPARVAAQIVVGIGFLGAGTILNRDNRIHGLTTAAGLWVSAAIGMAVGVGFYLVAIVGALLMLGVLMVNEEKILKLDGDQNHNDEISE